MTLESRDNASGDIAANPGMVRHGRLPYWSKVLLAVAVCLLMGLVLYDLFPSLVLTNKVDQFMDVVQVGDHREAIDSELRSLGFKVPEQKVEQKPGPVFYRIMTREPVLGRLADDVAMSLHKEHWWAEQKRPHHALVHYDEHNIVTTIVLGSDSNPLWH